MASTLDAPRFQTVIGSAAAGDDRAFDELVTPLIPQLRGYLRGIGRDETDDLLDDVLLAIFRNLGRFSGDEASFRSWVFTIAHNRAVDHHRKRRRTPEPLDDDLAARLADSPRNNPEHIIVERVAEQALLEVLSALPASQRQVLLLRTVGDLSLEQTAEVVGRSIGAVKLLQHRAVRSVRRLIEKVPEDA